MFSAPNIFAQKSDSFEVAKKLFEGKWVNKKDRRNISIFFEKGEDYATINDWVGKPTLSEQKNIDAYKAYIQGSKLIIYVNPEFHGVYCELQVVNNKLIYECNNGFSNKDNFLNRNTTTNKIIFSRTPK